MAYSPKADTEQQVSEGFYKMMESLFKTQAKSNSTKFCRASLRVLFKEIVEMGCFGKSQNIGNFSYTQIAVPQQDFSLPQNAFRNNLRGGFVQRLFYCSVQMVYMDV